MATKVEPIPKGYRSITPDIVVKDVSEAIEFYKNAFGAEEIFQMSGPDGKVMHAEVQIGDSRLMLCSETREKNWLSPASLGGSSSMLYVYVNKVDEVFNQALLAGAKVDHEVTEMFWGDRVGQVIDPSGHRWSLATHTRDLTPEQIEQGREEFFASMSKT